MEMPTSLSSLHNNSAAIVLGCGLGAVGAYYLTIRAKNAKKRNHLTKLRKLRQKERQEQFGDFAIRFPFDNDSATIVDLPFDVLVDKLQKRELKAKQVLEAYIAKTLLVTQEFNCVTQFIDKAIEWANELDALPEVKGPLHGVPICIKEDHDVEGMDSTLGMSIYLNNPKAESAVMVKVLQEAGAVPFCKTNLPQTTLSASSDNPIYGTTLNPINKLRSPGGSSSGTGCLVGAGGALFGLGSDIGGSLRLPSHYCGVSTLKSTTGRLSGRGMMPCLEECAGLISVSGIIASKASTLAGVYKTVVTDALQNQHDPLVVPIPWRSELFESKKPLRIGYLTSIPIFPCLGDTPDTILKAKETLEAVGHTLIPFEIPNSWDIYKILIAVFTADLGSQTYQKIQYDEIGPATEKFKHGRSYVSLLCLKLARIFLNTKPVIDVEGVERSEVLWGYLAQQRAAKYMVLDEMKRCEVDVILMPVYPYPAPLLGETEHIMGSWCYTGFWNVLDFPAGVVPFGKETATKIGSYDDEGDYFLELAKKSASTAQGLPIGVQIVGKPFQEEVVLRVLTELERHQPQK